MDHLDRPYHSQERELTLAHKFKQINWGLIGLVTIGCGIGVVMLYSAANGDINPWAYKHIERYLVGLILMIGISLIDLRVLLRSAYFIYSGTLLLLIAVELFGFMGMGAQRWIDLYLIKLQPSELMKLALVLALAKYFHGRTYEEVGRLVYLTIPLLMILSPVVLVMRQPDLGTAVMILLGGVAMFFLAGVRIWKFVVLFLLTIASVPIGWQFLLEYQKNRILIFLSPGSDPLGSGYHLLQSKIALGSGGVFGKGFLKGSQSHLKFLPEKQTDFIFTMLAEEFGLIGGLSVILLFLCIIGYG
jgi:rod shape determining protein RodA